MLSKNQLKHLQALRMGKFRAERQEFIAEGDKLARELLASDYRLTGVYALPKWLERNESLVGKPELPVVEIEDYELGRISGLVTPQEVLVTASIPHAREVTWQDLTGPLVVLDHIQDPGNLGTIIRTADWFGFHHLVCSKGTVELYNPKVIQATMGSFLRVKVHYRDLAELFGEIPSNRMVYGSYAGGDDVFKVSLDPDGIILIGNESKGISPDLARFIRQRIGIPSFSGGADSLNASVAVAVLLAEFRRQNNPS